MDGDTNFRRKNYVQLNERRFFIAEGAQIVFRGVTVQAQRNFWSNLSKLHGYLNMTWLNHASTLLSRDVTLLMISGSWLQRMWRNQPQKHTIEW